MRRGSVHYPLDVAHQMCASIADYRDGRGGSPSAHRAGVIPRGADGGWRSRAVGWWPTALWLVAERCRLTASCWRLARRRVGGWAIPHGRPEGEGRLPLGPHRPQSPEGAGEAAALAPGPPWVGSYTPLPNARPPPSMETPIPTLLGVTPTTLGPLPSILGVGPRIREVVVCWGVSLAW